MGAGSGRGASGRGSGRKRLHPREARLPGAGAGTVQGALPEGGAFGPRDFQEVVTILQLEVNEDQSDGVS